MFLVKNLSVIFSVLFTLTAYIPDEQLASCGAADCGLNISVNGTTTRPAQKLVWTLVGCYIGNASVYFDVTVQDEMRVFFYNRVGFLMKSPKHTGSNKEGVFRHTEFQRAPKTAPYQSPVNMNFRVYRANIFHI